MFITLNYCSKDNPVVTTSGRARANSFDFASE